MTTSSILAEGRLTETMQAVKDYFEQGGSLSVVAAVVGVCLGVPALTCWLTRRLDIRAGRTGNPHQLFHQALDRLSLSPPQRSMLTTVAIAQGLENPVTLLLSRSVFDRSVDAWLGLKLLPGIDGKTKALIHLARELRSILFPPRSRIREAGDTDQGTGASK